MLFKKKKDEDFVLKTEEIKEQDYYDNDFFTYEDDYDDSLIIKPYKAKRNLENDNIYTSEITTNYDVSEQEDINNYDIEENKQVNNYNIEQTKEIDNYDIEETKEINNYNITEKEQVNNYEINIENNKKENIIIKKVKNIHLPSRYKLIYILNRIASVVLCLTVVAAIMILFDVIMLTRFEKGPIFAIKTKTYNDGGTKEYHGIGYKVIKYNITNGRHDMVVGNYSIKYSK